MQLYVVWWARPTPSLVTELCTGRLKHATSGCFSPWRKVGKQIDRQRKDYRRGPFARNVMQRGKITQLHRLRFLREDPACLDELLGRLLLAYRIYHLGAP